MSNVFAKTRPQDMPYAIYRHGNFMWHVCKTYSKDPNKPYARFFVWASSPMTCGSFEGGDAYASDILDIGWLVACEPEWTKVYGPYSRRKTAKLPTPTEYLGGTLT